MQIISVKVKRGREAEKRSYAHRRVKVRSGSDFSRCSWICAHDDDNDDGSHWTLNRDRCAVSSPSIISFPLSLSLLSFYAVFVSLLDDKSGEKCIEKRVLFL